MGERFESDDDGLELVPVPMDRATRERLVTFARAVGAKPTEAASMLLADLLAEDEFWHAAAQAGSSLN